MGYPIIIVIGTKVLEEVPKLEIHINGIKGEYSKKEILSSVAEYFRNKKKLINE